MRKGTAFAIVALAVVVGFGVGRWVGPRKATDTAGSATGPVPGAEVERKKVPLGGDAKGPADALVNIVEFSDFQCPFCSRVNPSIERLFKEYPGKIRVFFRHYPLPFHADAPLASQAAMAAGAQGKFWEMHDKLFANQQALKRPDLERYAQELGLDMAKFKQALDSKTYQKRIDDDMALGGQVGVTGTPASFVNGRLVSGAQPYEEFKKVVDEELKTAQALLSRGVAKSKIYDELMKTAGQPPAPAPAQPQAQAPSAPSPVPADVFKVTLGNAATKGAKQPKVVIIEFSEFQCPFCARAVPTMAEVLKAFPDDVALAFKHFPLDFHQGAKPAAIAAEAAREQGKFWEMHDKLFTNPQSLDRATFEKYAQELNLDMAKFKAALDSGKYDARLEEDKKQAAQFGVTGTPTFFVNGRRIIGAESFATFKAVIEEEIKKADEKLKGGTPRKDLYAALIKDGKDKVPPPEPPPARPGQPAPGIAYKVPVAGAPMKGAKDALVTIVQFSDYECPFCSRVEPTMKKIMDEYKGKVRVVWRDYPLPFHQNATPAAIVARVAGEQGKFWEMHEKLFANQQALDRASLEKYAQELGLNAGKVKAALDAKKYEKEIKADMDMGQAVGVSGTPASFINGVFLSGAQPYEAFKARIDEELGKAEALVKKGVPKAKVYDEIMKTALASVHEATPAVKVDLGKAPVRGPKNAPVTVVLFSDFQCPFCAKVEPSLTQLEKDFKGKVRIAWKDYPLPFHNDAKPAAAAARAAGEQGKFWEMHEKLFANQQSLDRASLEKYAQELGLNMAKFKAAMDSNKYSEEIDADMKQGQALGVNGTPATFINGRLVSGAQPYDEFKKAVEAELNKNKKGS